METYAREETIAALGTAPGRGGIAVLRISGSRATEVANAVFTATSGKRLADFPHGKMLRGSFSHEGAVIDDGMAVVFFAPHSFTGEDVVELYCHGGILLCELLLAGLYAAGAAPALAGEFTGRAFLHGKIGLSAAEAVMDAIDGETPEKLRLAAAQAGGVFARETDALAAEVRRLVASTYAFIDFPDEDLTDLSPAELAAGIAALREKTGAMLATYRHGRAVSEGVPTVLFGRPNTGKSSILNALFGAERAIVSPEAGTTRDTVEETVALGKIMLRLADTAGIREASGVEGMGVARARQKLAEAELVLAVFDGSEPLTAEDTAVLAAIRASGKQWVALVNKSDKGAPVWDADTLGANAVFVVSAATGDGINEAKNGVAALFLSEKLDYNNTVVLRNARQFHTLREADAALAHAADALAAGFSQDMAALDLEMALSHLSALDGRQVSEEIVSEIFSRFCVGK